MGAFLDHPKTLKDNQKGEGKNNNLLFKWAASWMQGWRIDMEDAHFMHPIFGLFTEWSFFAVFDGHAGGSAAEYSEKYLLETIIQTEEFEKLSHRNQSEKLSEDELTLLKNGLTKGFLMHDSNLQTKHEDGKAERERSGTTAVMTIITPHHFIFSNLGDSRGLLCRKNEIFGTTDHKPYLDQERDRIVNAGGSVMIQRVNGSLAVSRAFGDFEYKTVTGLPQNKQLVSPEPDVYVLERKPEDDEFLVLACDGVYDVLENNELCEIVRSRLIVCKELKDVTDQVLDICLSKGSRDNMTMILIVFEQAPKYDAQQFEEESKWREQVDIKIQEYLKRPEVREAEMVDAESVQNYLKEKAELDILKPGGMHLCRPLIHKALESRGVSAPQANNMDVA